MTLAEEIKQWCERRNRERKEAYETVKLAFLGFYRIEKPDDVPNKKAVNWYLSGKRTFVRPKRSFLLKVGRGKFAQYNLVDVFEKR